MNKTALITGASKRVGKAIAEHLAEKGWNVIVHFNSSEKSGRELKDELSKKFPGQNFQTIQTNLTDELQVEKLIPRIVDKIGRFDLLVNNASLFNPGYISETSPALFNSQMDVNLKAPFILIRDFAKHCKTGNIINFVDTRITTNKSNFSAYSLSKKGLWELTKMAALEFASEIRVNAIAPGVTLPPGDKDEEYLWNLAKNIPMKKPGGLQPILKSIDYILGNEHLTGQLLFADGGENLGQNA
ncbi:MAG: SDR family NAD(P)-dependent oxidoreductase [Bacteroidota bacterium]